MNILIVEDDFYSAALLEEFFKISKDFNDSNVNVIHTGEYIIKDAIKYNADVILLDIMLPTIDGISCIKLLNSIELTNDIPIIVTSAKLDQDDVKNAIMAGCFEYIKKPINFLELTNKVKMAYKYRLNSMKSKKYQLYANVNDSLLQARHIQSSLFPDKNRMYNVFPKHELIYMPKDILTGDFVWLNRIDEDKKLIFIGDCTGHGLPGSLLTVMAYTLLDQNLNYRYEYKPSEILNYLSKEFNQLLNSQDSYTFYDGLDGICLFFDDKYVEYASSRMNMIVISKRKKIMIDGNEKIPCNKNNDYYLFNFSGDVHSIGRESIDKFFKNNRIKMSDGDRIYLFTDGYVDQFGGNFDKPAKFSKKRFYNLLLEIQEYSLEDQKNKLYNIFREWKGELDQLDDILIFIIEI